MGGTSSTVKPSSKYLTFTLGGQDYGIDILRVQEIIGMMPVTRVPRTPEFVRGVINLRGRVIPVIDLRTKFALGEGVDSERTCIIVVQLGTEDGAVMGAVVDEVSEVRDIAADEIEQTPDFGAGINAEFVLGIGKVHESVVMLLDVDRVLTSAEFEDLAELIART